MSALETASRAHKEFILHQGLLIHASHSSGRVFTPPRGASKPVILEGGPSSSVVFGQDKFGQKPIRKGCRASWFWLTSALMVLGAMVSPASAQSARQTTFQNTFQTANNMTTTSWEQIALSQIAQNSSPLPGIQKHFHQGLGLTGKGVRIHVVDLPRRLNGQDHGGDMVHLIRQVAPDATIQSSRLEGLMSGETSVFPKMAGGVLEDSPEAFEGYVMSVSAQQVDQVTEVLEGLARLPQNRRPQVVNLSVSISRLNLAEHLQLDLETCKPDSPQLAYPRARFQVYGLMGRSNAIQSLTYYLEQLFREDAAAKGPYSQAMARYQKACALLSQQNVVIHVASGNDGAKYPGLVSLMKPDCKQNWFADSSDVLVVGASNNGQTPDDFRDDVIDPITTRGRLDILLPGSHVQVGERVIAGASGATAFASGLTGLIQGQRQVGIKGVLSRYQESLPSQSDNKIPWVSISRLAQTLRP